ncbi:ABC transporter ATP-binding protein [Lysinibacillus telephonicus]|uniref:ABC transporter ATP-binding protein n=1 Tax=Lysinibacillus telephonicus TaxID=1714840 RepID=A0A431UJZ2_9BACI|nr:ABC transporter ATP-binding protein [Lysinibacillus telephonicus]RTQ90049.1 ABC transporter ATP-binding protein [Lysinibacillus telephonicus]
METDVLLRIKDLHIGFRINESFYNAVDGVSLTLRKNEILAIVGESGCGKSTLATSIIGLFDRSNTRIQGEILFKNKNLATLTEDQLNDIRGLDISMIFQDPLSALNPLMRIGEQIEEGLIYHTKFSSHDRKRKVLELLKQVGIQNPNRVSRQFPHQLSGGMRQRVMIAIAISCKPKIIIADEPTTALDVTIQAQILDLLVEMQQETGAGIILITHDLGIVAEVANRVAVMYAGEIIEEAPVKELFLYPKHPYTRSLLHSIPQMNSYTNRLNAIEGMVPSLKYLPRLGCRFSSRIPWIRKEAHEKRPALHEISPGHFVRCTCWKEFHFNKVKGDGTYELYAN